MGVRGPASSRVACVRKDGFSGPSSGEECLTDSLSRHGISCGSGIANKECAFVRERNAVNPRGNWPCSMRTFCFCVGSEKVTNVRSIQQFTPERSHVADAVGTVVAQDSETDVGGAVG